MTNSPIFIVGCPRSGTGLLRNLLRSHPLLAFPTESHFIPKLYRAYGDPRNEREARTLAAVILKTVWVQRWEINLPASAFGHFRSYRAVVSRLFEDWKQREGKTRWGDKTPQYVSEIPTLLEIFPSSKIIHIYRDGRDAALSWVRAPFGPENIYVAAQEWRRFVNAGRRVGVKLSPETYLEVRYETLLAEPEATMMCICEFINEPYSRKVLKPNLLRANRHSVFWHPHRMRVSETEVVRSNSGMWRNAMRVSDQVIFESVAGDLLRELGYKTEGKIRHVSQSEHLRWIARHYFWFILKRLGTRDKNTWIPSHLLLRWATFRCHLRSAGVLGPPVRGGGWG